MSREEHKRVYILARKTLTRNTRIFKQAKSLTEAGYEVLLIGVKARDGVEWEERDGYTIHRLTLRPLHGRIPRAVNRALLILERGVPGPPARAVRALRLRVTAWLRRELARLAFPFRSWEYYKESYKVLRSGLPAPTVFHANDLDTLLIGVLLARRYRRPLVYDAQELYTGMHTLPPWYRDVLELQERVLIRFADRVTVVNDAIGEVMESRYGRPMDGVILNCPPYEAAGNGRGPTLRERCGVPAGARVLLYSGGLTASRGIETTVKALAHLPGWELVILGEGPLRDPLEELAANAGLGDRVHFTDFVAHDAVPAFIRSADVGVIPYERTGPNHYLCSPSKLFHYIMAELPIACSDFPFLQRVVIDNGIGATFDPADPADIAQAVRRITDEPAVYDAMKERLRVVKHRYSWEEEEKRFTAVYRSLEDGR